MARDTPVKCPVPEKLRHCCPLSSNFPSRQLIVLVRCRLPLNFPRFTAYRPPTRAFSQPGSLQEALAGLRGEQSSLSRTATRPPEKPAKRAPLPSRVVNEDSSSQVRSMGRGIFVVTGQLPARLR